MWRSWIVPLAAAAAGVALSFMVRGVIVEMEDRVIGAQFDSDVAAVSKTIAGELDAADETLLAMRAFFAGSNEVDSGEFGEFAQRIRDRHDEVELLFWAERAEDGGHVVRFTEPPAAREIGQDLAADPGCLAAIRGIGKDGRSSAAPPDGPRMLLFVQGNSVNQKGILAARIVMSEVAARALERLGSPDHVGLALVDVEGPEAVELYRSGEPPEHVETRSHAFGQRDLAIRVGRGPGYAAARRTPASHTVFLAMLLATALAIGYVWMLQSRTAKVEKLVEERTATIREVTRFQHAILESAEYAIIAFDPDGRILKFNPAAERMLGFTESEVVDRKGILDFVDPETAPRTDVPPDLTLLLRQAGRGVVGPWTFRRSDGTTFPGSISVSALHDEADRITGFLAIARDIRTRLEAEEELRKAKAQAEAASRTKSQFLANMSHELRTPLTAILGYAEMLEEDATGTRAVEDLRKIQQAGRHLLRLIDDVLDLSKVEAGRVDLQPERVEVPRLMEDIASTVRPLAQERGNALTIDCDDVAIETDPTRLKQVLVNLVANAARFTKNGRIFIDARRDGDAVVFRVRDTGIGMTAEELGRVFDPFVQADGTTTRKFGGTGLGLAIAREFTELMGGSLEAESEPGTGSEFRVRVPLGPS